MSQERLDLLRADKRDGVLQGGRDGQWLRSREREVTEENEENKDAGFEAGNHLADCHSVSCGVFLP
jgi:hypothetical protein